MAKKNRTPIFTTTGLQAIAIALFLILVVNVLLLIFNPFTSGQEATPVGPSPVSLTIVTNPDCTTCFDPSALRTELEGAGVLFDKQEEVLYDSSKGKRLIKKYGFETVPALLFSKEMGEYTKLASAWELIGSIASDGSYLLDGVQPPYYELATGKVRGTVDLVFVDDPNCTECYDPAIHRQVLDRFAMAYGSMETVDVNTPEGEALVEKYSLTAVPTLLLRGDVDLYKSFNQVWAGVGDIADDGTYVFRNLNALGVPYYNLSSGLLVTPQAAK